MLLPEVAAALGPERFQREIKLAARLQHPHILGVFDSGEAAGRLWFTMPFVEGESLRDRIRRERQLGLDEALRIGREVASALDYAHRHGVIHRDIKPENILLTADGVPLVGDFGIARALSGEQEQLTQTGFSIGTPAYMSPEQAAGDKGVDARSDVYSLGSVVYEMLAGEPPFTGPTAQAIVMKRMTEAPPSVRRVRVNVPEEVDSAILRALAPVPADRFATAGEFGAALSSRGATATRDLAGQVSMPGEEVPRSARDEVGRKLRRPTILTLALGFLLGLGALFAWRRSHSESSDKDTRVLAVMPFENLGDSSQAYFADGVADEVRGKLARLQGLSVIAGSSSDEYRDSGKRLEEIARELGADYLLVGRVRWSKSASGVDRVRVTPELVDVRPGRPARARWQEPFDAALTDVFTVQAEIAQKVAAALDVTLGDTARRQLGAKPTANLTAYDLYLQAVAVTRNDFDIPSTRRAIALCEQAVALDPGFVAAWSRLARERSYLYSASTARTPAMASAALEAVERTRALAPDAPETFLALRGYYINVLNDPQRALSAAEAGLERDPNNLELLSGAALMLAALGREEQALERWERIVSLDPRSGIAWASMSTTLRRLRRHAEAATALDRALLLAPASITFRHARAEEALFQGDLPGAKRVVAEAPSDVDRGELGAYFSLYGDLYWLLDEPTLEQVVALPPSAFEDDRAYWAIIRAQIYKMRGQEALARAFADTARMEFASPLRPRSTDGQDLVTHGLALAYLGRKAEAIAMARRGVEAGKSDPDFAPYNQLQLARVYLLTGEPELAVEQLELLTRMRDGYSAGWFRVDPNFASLKGNPRFDRLVAGG